MTIQIEARAFARRTVFTALAVAAVAMSIGAVGADGSAEPISGLQIEDAVVTPVAKGETALVGFRIENFSSQPVTLIGARSDIAESTVIVIDEGGGTTKVATAVLIGQNETLDLRSSHLWVELRDVTEPIETGDLVSFELVFATGTAGAQAHAHSWTSNGNQ